MKVLDAGDREQSCSQCDNMPEGKNESRALWAEDQKRLSKCKGHLYSKNLGKCAEPSSGQSKVPS